MSGITDQGALDLLSLVFNATTWNGVGENDTTSPFTDVYLGLHTADPGAGNTQDENECDYTDYTREAVVRASSAITIYAAGTPVSVTTLAVSSGTVTVTTGSAHGWSTDQVVRIEGVTSDTRLNGVFQITVTTTSEFTYSVSGPADTTGASGTITATTPVMLGFDDPVAFTQAGAATSNQTATHVSLGWVAGTGANDYFARFAILPEIPIFTGVAPILSSNTRIALI